MIFHRAEDAAATQLMIGAPIPGNNLAAEQSLIAFLWKDYLVIARSSETIQFTHAYIGMKKMPTALISSKTET